MLEVRLGQGVGQGVRVVDHEHARGGDELTEGDAGGGRPGAVGGVVGRVVAQHDDVEVVHPRLHRVLLALHGLEVALEGAVVLVRAVGEHGQGAVRLVGEVPRPEQVHLMAGV